VNEAVSYALLVVLGVAIISSTFVVFDNLQTSLMSVAIKSEANRVLEYVSRNVLLAYKTALEGANTTITLELPSSIQGCRYYIKFNVSINGEKQIVLLIPVKNLSVIKKLSTIDESILFQGQIDSRQLKEMIPVIRASLNLIVLEVVPSG